MVNETTFAGFLAEAFEHQFRTARLKTPSLEHLFALKLHALKQGLPRRDAKDFGDLTQLIYSNRVGYKATVFASSWKIR